MADVKKTVQIALQIVGTDTRTLKGVTTAFEKIQTTIEASVKAVGNFQTALNNLKVPSALKSISDAFANLKNLKLPTITGFTNNIKKLDGLKIPSFTSLASQLTKLSQIEKFPSVVPFVNGLKKISSLRIGPIIEKIKELNTALKKLEERGGISAFKKFASDVSSMKTAFSSAASSMTKMNDKMRDTGQAAQDAGLKLGTFAGKVKTVLTFRVISAAIQGLNTAVTSGVTAIIEYDQALKDLQAITGATSLEVAQMGTKIIEVASTTKFSASEVAQGMRTIGQAGFSAGEAVETMQAVSDLATGTLSDMGTTVDLVTTAMRVFRIDASKSGEIADVFANAVNRSKLTIDKLRTAMNFVGPIARDSGVSFKELAASMGTLANSGLRASTIGTGLRRIFAELVDPSKKLKEAIKGSGVALSELDPRANSLSTVLSNLGIVVNDASIAFDVFGKRGASAVLSLTSASSGFDGMLETLSQSGTAARQAATQMEGLGVSFKNMRDKAGLLAIAIGEAGVSKAMKIFVDVVRLLIDGLTYLVGTVFGQLVVGLGLVTVAILAVSQALAALKFAAAFTGITTAVTTLFTAISSLAILAEASVASLIATMLFNPITLAILAVVSALTGLVWWLGKARKEAEETAKLSAAYEQLSKTMKNYAVDVAGMSKETKEFTDANLILRKSLLDTAENYSAVATEALAAALSIDPLTGKIEEGSIALEEYNKKLQITAHLKLIEANDAINESFGKLEIGGKSLGFLGLQAKGVGTHFEQARQRVAELEGQVKKLSSSEKKLIQDFHALESQSARNIIKMKELGKLNINDTVENFTRLAKAQDASGEVLEAMVEQFKTMQEQRAPKNLIEKWAKDGSYAIGELFTEYENISGEFGTGKGIFGVDAQGVSEKELIIKSVAAKKALKIRYDALQAETAAMIAAGKDEEMVARRHHAMMAEMEAEANRIKVADSENESLQKLKILQKEQRDRDKILAQNLENNRTNVLERVKIEDAANAAYAKSREQLRESAPVDLDDQTTQHKAYLDEIKLNHQNHLNAIALAEAQGVLTTEQAASDKAAAELLYYKEREGEAIRYYKLIEGLEGEGDAQAKRLSEQKKASAATAKFKTDALIKYNAEVAKANTKLKDLDGEYADEVEKNGKKVAEIKKRVADDFLEVDKDYADKKADLDKESAEITMKYQDQIKDNKDKNVQDEYDLTLSAEDAIRGIKEKGLSDEAKQASQQSAALKKLAEGRRLVNEYYLWGDEANLANGKELLDQALGMTGAFTDQTQAIRLVKDATNSLKQVSGFEKEIADQAALTKMKEEEAKVEAKRVAAKLVYDEKYANAANAINKIITKENERHKKEMRNLLDELKVYQLKLKIAKELIQTAGGAVPAALPTNFASNAAKEVKNLERQIALLDTVKQEKVEIAQIDTISVTEDENGIKSYTNSLRAAGGELKAVRKEGVLTIESIDKSIDTSLKGVWEDIGEDGVSTFREIGSSATDAFKEVAVGASSGDNTFDKIKGSAAEAVKSMSGLSDSVGDVKDKTEEGVELTPYQKLNDEVIQLSTSIEELVNIDKIFDIVAKVIGYDDVEDLIKAIDKLKNKTVTITTKYVTQGNSPSGKYATGGRLPGFGGGDKHQILAESGEWIIRKEAVRKFGDNFMSSINNMTLPKFQNGGRVNASASAPTKTGSILGSLANFGTVSLDTGTASIPAIVQQDVVGQLTTHLNNLKRFST